MTANWAKKKKKKVFRCPYVNAVNLPFEVRTDFCQRKGKTQEMFLFSFLIPFLLKLESDALHIGNWVIKTHHATT